jgi:hypothetical protein
MSLRRTLAEHGFESNDDYEHALRCLFGQELAHLRVLHVDGAAGRRKTAFAQALGRALEYGHVLYHDFSAPEPPAPAVIVTLAEGGQEQAEPALSNFERIMTEACAYSEAAQTMLILDQLQAAHFGDQARLYRFVMTREWSNSAGTVAVNPKNFLLALITEQPLFHSLAKCSFRIWTDAQGAFLDYRPAEFGFGPEATDLFAALANVFVLLQAAPTPSEFAHLLADLGQYARSAEQIRQSLFGRVESVDRHRLYAPELSSALHALLAELERFLGADEVSF